MWIQSLGREDYPGGGHGNPLQYSRLDNPVDRGDWRTMVHRVTQSRTRLKQFRMHACEITSVVSDSVQPCGLRPARHLSSWDSLGKNTGVGCHALLQQIFPTQGLNSGLHCRQILYHLSNRKVQEYWSG